MEESIQNLIREYPEWRLVDNQLIADWKTEDFSQLQVVVTQLCELAEELNHHPAVTYAYNTLQVVTTTHDAGNTVTELDIALARKVSALFE